MRFLIATVIELLLLGLSQGAEPPAYLVSEPPSYASGVVVQPTTDPSASTCYVWLQMGGVGQAGTGTVIGSEGGKSLVITNAHVVEGTNAPVTVIHSGNSYRASVLAVARRGPGSDPDLSLVLVDGELPSAPIATEEPRPGERVRLWGFGGRLGTQGAREKVGRFLGRMFNPSNVNSSIPTISGDSGSGWFNDAGELVAVHWGNDGQAWAVPLQSIRSFVQTRASNLFPRLVERLAGRKASAPKVDPPAAKMGAGCRCDECKCKDKEKCPSLCPVSKAEPNVPRGTLYRFWQTDANGRVIREWTEWRDTPPAAACTGFK